MKPINVFSDRQPMLGVAMSASGAVIVRNSEGKVISVIISPEGRALPLEVAEVSAIVAMHLNVSESSEHNGKLVLTKDSMIRVLWSIAVTQNAEIVRSVH